MTTCETPFSFGMERNSSCVPDDGTAVIEWALGAEVLELAIARKIDGFGRVLASSQDWRARLLEMEQSSTSAARWLRAAVLEARDDWSAAAAVFDSFTCSNREVEALRLLGCARNLTKADRAADAILPLKRAVRMCGSHAALNACSKLLKSIARTVEVPYKRTCRLALVGNATFDLLVPALTVTAFASGIKLTVFRGSYNQHAQEIFDSASALWKFAPDILVIANDWRALALSEEVESPDTAVQAKVKEITDFWEAAKRLRCFVVQHNFAVPETSAYGRLSAALATGRAQVIRRINLELARFAETRSGVAILDIDQIASLVGKNKWEDRRMWIAAKQYPSAEATPVLVAHQIALLRGILGLASKCLVLDLDNTLWGGVIGEDGLEGIRIGGGPEGEAFAEFQMYVKALSRRGIILAVCSKNNESDAKLPFERHPEMVLRLEDISMFVANWKPKAENLRAIAKTLNIGIDSLVFVDDNPVERELVRKELPEVEVPELPKDPARFAEVLDREMLFEAITLSQEDRTRSESYRANVERQHLQERSTTLDAYLTELQMAVQLRSFDDLNLPRIVQLINKTNQFNLTTVRMTAGQVKEYSACSRNYTQFMHLRDRFGDNGVTGVLMASPQGDTLTIDCWLMSCRVLGRRIDEAMLASVWNAARANGFRWLRGIYIPSAKNQQVIDLYARLGFRVEQQLDCGERRYIAELTHDRAYPHFMQVEDLTSACSRFDGSK